MNKRGFTLIELVVVIAIMGVILILALPQVSKIQQANKDKKYDAYHASVERGAKLYIDTYAKDLFGNNNSGCVTVEYSKLKKQNLAKDFGSSEVTCSEDSETYVEVRKVNSEYLYSTAMVCRDEKKKIVYQKSIKDDFTCENVQDEDGPKVIADPESHDWVQTKNLKVKIKVSDQSTLNKNIGIIYYWTDLNGKKVSGDYKYNYKNKKGVQTVSYLIPTKNILTASGQYKLVVKPWESALTSGIQDALGNKTLIEKSFGPYKIDNVKPTCGTVNGAKTNWTNKDFTITQGCNDDASGCEKNPYSKTFTTSTKTYDFTIKDKAGNTNTCKVNVYLDVDKPTCGKVTGGSTDWTNQDRKIGVGCNDTGGSNCSKTNFEQTFSSEGTTDSITVSDVAGNTRSCPVDKYIDKTAPNCGSISGQSTTWTASNRQISVGCSDSLSKCSQNTFSKTFDYSIKTDNITIKDNANNTKSCSVDVYVDKTPPSAPTSGSIGSVSGSNKNASIKTGAGGSTDDHSGVKEYLYIISNNSTTPGKDDSRFGTATGFTRSCGTSYYAWAIAVDNVGNRSAVKGLGSTSDGANKYSNWSGCSARCPTTTGTQTRTNSCALVTTGLSQSCSISCGPPPHTHTLGYTGKNLVYTGWCSVEDSHGCHESYRLGYCSICWSYGVKYRCGKGTGCTDSKNGSIVDWNYNCPISPYYPIVVDD